MIRRGVKLQLAAFAAITAVGVSYVGATYAGLDRWVDDGYSVRAEFTDSGGIFSGAEVSYRGVTVGRVGALHLSGDGVGVDLRVTGEHRIPADTVAVVANRSAVGEQYVDLQPRSAGGPYLRDGSVIRRADTRTPLATSTLLLTLDRLVNSVDRRDLAIVVDELGKAFAGTGSDLRRLIESGDLLTEAAIDALPETIRLLEDGRTVLATQQRSGSDLRAFAHNLALLTGQLRSSDADLRAVLAGGTTAARELDRLLTEVGPTLPVLLGNLISVGQVAVARLPGIEQLLVTYPVVVAGGFTVAPGDGTAHFGLQLNLNDPPSCTQGYGGTQRRTPQDTGRTAANTSARCTAAPSSGQLVRGAANAPGGGTGPSRAGGGGGGTGGSAGPSGAPTPAYVSGYDPVTGAALGPDGSPVVVGSHGGQHRLLGEDSWQSLLIGPLT